LLNSAVETSTDNIFYPLLSLRDKHRDNETLPSESGVSEENTVDDRDCSVKNDEIATVRTVPGWDWDGPPTTIKPYGIIHSYLSPSLERIYKNHMTLLNLLTLYLYAFVLLISITRRGNLSIFFFY